MNDQQAVAMGWQVVPAIVKRDGHYTPNNAEKWCTADEWKLSRNRLHCLACGAKKLVSR